MAMDGAMTRRRKGALVVRLGLDSAALYAHEDFV
jgi:hypothetical protein